MLPAWGLYRWVPLRTLVTSPLQRLGNRAADTVTVVSSLCFLENWLCVVLLPDPGVRSSAARCIARIMPSVLPTARTQRVS